MAGQLEDAFYRNKRAALLSSAVLFVATAFSLHVSANASLYIFRIDDIPNEVIVLIMLATCAYLNVSYFLHYATEVPQWKRSPESVLEQTESVRSALEELKNCTSKEEEALRKSWTETKFPVDRLLEALDNPALVKFPADLESKVSQFLRSGQGLIYVEAFNQISKAVHADPKTRLAVATNISWDHLANRVVEKVSESVHSVIAEQHKDVIADVREQIRKLVSDVTNAMTVIQKGEEERLANFAVLNDKLEKTERDLRRWRSVMNFRVRIQFLYFPIAIFGVASIYAIISLFLHYVR
jgi:hypothetical protein